MLETIERETGAAPRWSVLWLHGLGADGHDFAPLVPELVRPQWPALRFVFPHAPVRPITINNGMRMRGWYDIAGLDFASRADVDGVEESIAHVQELLRREHERGIAADHVLLAGFSQGGAIALAAGLRQVQPLAGLIALSTYLPDAVHAGNHLQPQALSQPVFMAHGLGDPVVPLAYAETSVAALRALGFEVQWQRYPMGHQVCAEEIDALREWMDQRLAAG